MTPSETQRFRLREGLGELLKDEDVRTLMESLPPVDWHELATKEDLAALEERVNVRFDAVDVRFDADGARFDAVDVRFDAVGARFDAVDVRFDAVGARFDAVDVRFDAVGARFDAVGARFDAVDVRIDAVGARIDAGLTKMGGEAKRDVARQTYVILAGLAAIITPIYIALFTGAGG